MRTSRRPVADGGATVARISKSSDGSDWTRPSTQESSIVLVAARMAGLIRSTGERPARVREIALDEVDLADLAAVGRHPERADLARPELGLDRPSDDGQLEPRTACAAARLDGADDE